MKGETNNPNGRPKGTPNKLTGQVKELLSQALENGLESFSEDLESLEPKDRLSVLMKLASFVIPKPKPEGEAKEWTEQPLFPDVKYGNPPNIIWKSELDKPKPTYTWIAPIHWNKPDEEARTNEHWPDEITAKDQEGNEIKVEIVRPPELRFSNSEQE